MASRRRCASSSRARRSSAARCCSSSRSSRSITASESASSSVSSTLTRARAPLAAELFGERSATARFARRRLRSAERELHWRSPAERLGEGSLQEVFERPLSPSSIITSPKPASAASADASRLVIGSSASGSRCTLGEEIFSASFDRLRRCALRAITGACSSTTARSSLSPDLVGASARRISLPRRRAFARHGFTGELGCGLGEQVLERWPALRSSRRATRSRRRSLRWLALLGARYNTSSAAERRPRGLGSSGGSPS